MAVSSAIMTDVSVAARGSSPGRCGGPFVLLRYIAEIRADTVGHQRAVWIRTAKDRESWRTLAEGYFLQWKDTA